MSEMAKKMKRPVYEKLVEVTCSSLLIMKENKQPVIFDTEEGSPYKIFCKVDSRRVNVIEAARDSEKDMFEHLILQNRIKAGVSNSTSRPRDLTLPPSSHITRDSRARTAPSSVDGTGGGDDPTEEGIHIDDPTPPRGKSQLDPQPHSSGSTTNIVIRSPLGKNVPVAVDKMQSLLKYPLSKNGESAEKSHPKSHIQSVDGKYTCTGCNKQFSTKSNFKRHIKTRMHLRTRIQSVHGKVKYTCTECNIQFSQKGNLRRHIQRIHAGQTVREGKKKRLPLKQVPGERPVLNLASKILQKMQALSRPGPSDENLSSNADSSKRDLPEKYPVITNVLNEKAVKRGNENDSYGHETASQSTASQSTLSKLKEKLASESQSSPQCDPQSHSSGNGSTANIVIESPLSFWLVVILIIITTLSAFRNSL